MTPARVHDQRTAAPSAHHASGARTTRLPANWINAAARRSTAGQYTRWYSVPAVTPISDTVTASSAPSVASRTSILCQTMSVTPASPMAMPSHCR